MNLFTKDAGERILRAFVTGAVTAALALHLHTGGEINIVGALTTNGLKPIIAGGVIAALTTVKALIGMGNGSNPDDGSLRGIVNGEES